MSDMKGLQEQLRQQRPVEWDQLPDFALYMDQVLSYMERQTPRYDEDDSLTAAMVNNYTKSNLVPRAEGKKYNREHLAYLTVICVLKHVMSARDMALLCKAHLSGSSAISDSYTKFCSSLDQALTLMADEMEAFDESTQTVHATADAAIHFALLSYAAGLASRRYVAALRQQQEETEEVPPSKAKKTAKKEHE